MKRLIVLLSVLCTFATAFAQHPHSKGGGPLYWALVGGISAVLYYAIFRGIPFILSLFKKRKRNNDDENVADSGVIESKTEEPEIITTPDEKDNQQSVELMKSIVNDDSLPKNVSQKKSKREKIIVGIILLIMSLLSIFFIEKHISEKRKMLSNNLVEQVMNSFNSNEDWSKRYVKALSYKNIEDLEYEEIAIPDFPNNGDKSEKRHWTNMFSDAEHLYKLTDHGWTMVGYVFHREWSEPYNDYSYSILQKFIFFPYMICVPKGTDFNLPIAQAMVNRALDSFYVDPEEFESVQDALFNSNEYFYLSSPSIIEREPDYSRIHYDDQFVGFEPIYENGKFTGNYWFTLQRIGPYRILYAYTNIGQEIVQEKDGFNGSQKDRILYYGLTFLLLSLLFVLYLFKDKIKLKPVRLNHNEKSDNQMYCKHCGKLVDTDSEFCKHCGKKL